MKPPGFTSEVMTGCPRLGDGFKTDSIGFGDGEDPLRWLVGSDDGSAAGPVVAKDSTLRTPSPVLQLSTWTAGRRPLRAARGTRREKPGIAPILMLLRSLKRATTVTLSTAATAATAATLTSVLRSARLPRGERPGRSERLAAWEAGRGCEGAARRVRAAAGA